MTGRIKKILKKLLCVAILASVLANRANEAKAAIYYVNPGGSIQSVIDDPNVKADLSHDYFVDFKDYAILANDWLKTDPNLPGDINGDNIVDYNDLEIFTRNWLRYSKIAFVSNRDGNYEIYVMNPNGSEQTRLTYNDADDTEPSWSPDGKKIAFASNRDDNYEIYVMNSDGSNQTRLTYNDANDREPAWSPDGTKIAFMGDKWCALYTINVSGDPNSLLKLIGSFYLAHPTWSPDGSQIAFMGVSPIWTYGSFIHVIPSVGGDIITITYYPNLKKDPAWSPNGKYIAFSFKTGTFSYSQIGIIPATGGDIILITNNNIDRQPSWSPDSNQIVFCSDRSGNYDIWTILSTGGNVTQLTDNPTDDFEPSWSLFLNE